MNDTTVQDAATNVIPVIAPGHTSESITDKIASIVLRKGFRPGWIVALACASSFVVLLLVAVVYLFTKGVGVWGIMIPAAWGFAIVNFVWWIGIGHAGTLISAILLLLKQEWRTSINRFAEAMTLFAVACAGMFPILHLGRPWLFYWLLPLPNVMNVWPQFRSPLMWDVFAVSTYGTVSLIFWYVGLIPDLATLRDRAKNVWAKRIYGMLSLGWRGASRHWHRYEMAYLLLGGLATPLVLSVHTVVSFDFAVSQVPGWHSTVFPPYFVAGAIYSGFAMVLTIAIPVRKYYGLEDFITIRHLNNMAKVTLATGLMVAYGYAIETFMAYYSGATYEKAMIVDRMVGAYAPVYWTLILCNIVIPQALWFRKVRYNPLVLWFISIVVNIGMWLERFVIVVQSLSHDFMASSWRNYVPTRWDVFTFLGTLGFFFMAMLLFIRVLPMISITEMKGLLHMKTHGDGHSTPDAAPQDKGEPHDR